MNRSLIQTAVAVVAAGALVLGGSGVADATTPHSTAPAPTSTGGSYQAVDLGASEGTTIPGSELSALADQGIRVELVNPSTGQHIVVADPGMPQGVVPQISVGLGWHIYVYLSRSDFIFLEGLAEAAVVTVICAAIGGSVGGLACPMIAAVVFGVVNSYAPPQQAKCKEIAIDYWGTLSSVKNVSGSHC